MSGRREVVAGCPPRWDEEIGTFTGFPEKGVWSERPDRHGMYQ